MRMRQRLLVSLFLFLIIVLSFPLAAFAEAYQGYIYDTNGDVVDAQVGYAPIKRWLGDAAAESGSLQAPTDLSFGPDGLLYVLDGGNGRIVKFTEELEFVGTLDSFIIAEEPTELSQPGGFFIDSEGTFYIADTGNARVLICKADGTVVQVLERPDSGLLAEDYEFKPTKVLLDGSGYLYVLSSGLYDGAMVFDQSYQFTGFFGGNRVAVTVSLLQDMFWKKIMNKETAQLISQYTPEEVTAFDIDKDGFIYTCSLSSTTGNDKVKKLNSQGKNILDSGSFGDPYGVYVNGAYVQSRFSDIYVDDNGFLSLLDMTRGRVFQYDQEGQLLMIFGGQGQRLGTFQSPVALEGHGDKLYVLDAKSCSVTVFQPTDFGAAVREASMLYQDGLYEEAVDAWETVHAMDINQEMAYQGIGKALMAEKKYKEAAAYFELAEDKENRSIAFGFYRTEWLKSHYLPIAAILTLCIAGVIVLIVLLRKRAAVKGALIKNDYGMGVLIHPFVRFEDMKEKRRFVWIIPIISVLFWFSATMLREQLSAFCFRQTSASEVNAFYILMQTVVLAVLFVVANWAVCTLLDGKGRIREIAGVVGYALIPYSVALLIYTVVSHFVTLDEAFFLQLILILGLIWTIVVLLIGLIQIHEYSFSKLLISLFLTVVAIAVIVFLFVLAFSLIQETYSFLRSIITELVYRFNS